MHAGARPRCEPLHSPATRARGGRRRRHAHGALKPSFTSWLRFITGTTTTLTKLEIKGKGTGDKGVATHFASLILFWEMSMYSSESVLCECICEMTNGVDGVGNLTGISRLERLSVTLNFFFTRYRFTRPVRLTPPRARPAAPGARTGDRRPRPRSDSEPYAFERLGL